VGDQIYIIPLSFIIESFQPKAGDVNQISGQGQVVHVRGEYLPMVTLHQVFHIKPKVTDPTEGILVLLETEGKKVALFVDELVGQHQSGDQEPGNQLSQSGWRIWSHDHGRWASCDDYGCRFAGKAVATVKRLIPRTPPTSLQKRL